MDPATIVALTSTARVILQAAVNVWKATGKTEEEFNAWFEKEKAEFFADDETTLPDV
jgi:hypothetical protein